MGKKKNYHHPLTLIWERRHKDRFEAMSFGDMWGSVTYLPLLGQWVAAAGSFESIRAFPEFEEAKLYLEALFALDH